MVTEDYVSFETAKLLREKGFDGPCYKVWETHGDTQTLVVAPWFVEGETVVNRESVESAAKYYAYEYNLNNNVEGYLAPTIQMALKWLREIHKLCITIIPKVTDDDGSGGCLWEWAVTYLLVPQSISLELFESYEQACEAAIKYCLENLI